MDTAEKIIIFWFLLKGVCCRDFNISLPEKIQALNGSCVVIKCRFEINETYDKELTETAAGVWIKDGHDFKNCPTFNSSIPMQNSFTKGKITGKLKNKDCTTVFYDVRLNHTGSYFFRIEGEGRLQWTYAKNNVSINVIESPVKPRVQLSEEQKELQDQLEVLEGRSVSLRCSAEAPCSSAPPTLTWSSTPRILLSQSSKLQELIISDLNFTAARRHHNVTFTCSISYQLQDNNKTANSSITLNIQYTPQISTSSSCNSTDVTVCFCEVDGNPSPEVQWFLSGRPVSNSSVTFISEERLSSTGLRSFIFLHQSLTNTNTLMCFSNNTHGNARRQLQLPSSIASWILFHVLIGVAVLALVILMSVITRTCVRKFSGKPQPTTQEKSAKGSGQNANEAADQENEEDVYVTMSSVGVNTENQLIHRQKSIIYSSTDFTKFKPRSQEVEGISSLQTGSDVVQHRSGGAAETESSMTESSGATGVQVIVSVDVVTKQTESKEVQDELLADSSQLYAKLQRRRPV